MWDRHDCKIVDMFLKKGTKQHTDDWNTSSKVWTHMVLHLSHTEVSPRNVRSCGWPLGLKDDLQDSSSWSSSPLMFLGDIHSKILTQIVWGLVVDTSHRSLSTSGDWSSSSSGTRPSQWGIPCEERTLPTLQSPPSRLRIGSPNKSLDTDYRSMISSRRLRSRVVMRNSGFARSNESSPRQRTDHRSGIIMNTNKVKQFFIMNR